MSSIGQITFTGASGKEYTFDVYNFSKLWNDVPAVYVVTEAIKNSNGHTHNLIYIGKTESLKQRFADHDHQQCFDKNRANRVCVKVESNKNIRTDVETDLIRNYNTPCNETIDNR